MKFVTYKRLSKEKKQRNQHGFESQQMDIDYYLSSQEGAEVIGEFQEFVSGAADVKPELEKALQLCRETGATLLVAKLDRLSRRVSQIASYMEGSVEFKVSTLPSANNFQLHLYAALAEEERANIRLRVKRGLEAAKAKGVLLGGANPKHKEAMQKNKHLHKTTRNAEKAKSERQPIKKIIEDMLEYSNNSLTQDEIASKLNSKGITTVRGNSFSGASVARIIKQEGIAYKRKHKNVSR